MNEKKLVSQLGRFAVVIVSVFLSFAGHALAQEECAQTKEELRILKKDYENALAQTKVLLEYKAKALEMETTIRQFDIVKQQLAKEKEDALSMVSQLKEKIKALDENIVALRKDKDEYKKSFEKASVENIISDDTKKKIEDLEQDRSDLLRRAEELESRIKVMENASLKEQAQSEFYKRQLAEVKDKYQDAKQQNKILERKLEATPKKFAELARENKILIKRTSAMHYNLGVFYTQNREYERALTEFEKAIELNPEDASSHFNLGYIYAEHLLNRPRAVMHFKQYLKLAKKDDKDVDWAKRYVLTWQAWEGKQPIK